MTYGAQETWRDVRTGNTGSIVDTITSNPIPAGMVALGLGMLFMNRGKQSRSRSLRRRIREPAGPTRGSRPRGTRRVRRTFGDVDASVLPWPVPASGSARSPTRPAARSMRWPSAIGQTAERLPQEAGRYVEQGGSQVGRFIDENPLGAGVIAMAAGAAIGMLLPTTPIEREAMGPARDQLVERSKAPSTRRSTRSMTRSTRRSPARRSTRPSDAARLPNRRPGRARPGRVSR